jgi:hypothetical protein
MKVHTRSSSRSSISLSRSHHKALKLILGNPKKNMKGNSKGKLAGVPRDDCHPLTTYKEDGGNSKMKLPLLH